MAKLKLCPITLILGSYFIIMDKMKIEIENKVRDKLIFDIGFFFLNCSYNDKVDIYAIHPSIAKATPDAPPPTIFGQV